MSTLYGTLLSNLPEAFVKDLETLTRFREVELQLELKTTQTNVNGVVFTPDRTPPFAWLEKRGVTVWAYVDVNWPKKMEWVNDPPEINQYWFERNQSKFLGENGLYLWGKRYDTGEHSLVLGSYNQVCPDTTRQQYIDWMASALLMTGIMRFRFDNGMIHRHSYYRPWKADKTDVNLNLGTFDLYDRLRRAGREVIVNGAWEMDDPDATDWIFSAAPHVDGVLIEHPGNGLARWSDGKWWSLTETRLEQVIEAWLAMDKRVIVSAHYEPQNENRKSRFASFDEHAHFYFDLAKRLGCQVTIGDGSVGGTWSHVTWLDWFPVENQPPAPPSPEPPDSALTMRIDGLERRIVALERKFDALRNSLM